MRPTLKPGMIGVNLKGAHDPAGTLNTVLQGDTQAAHVWWVLPSGKIATTGAKWGLFYGEVLAERYLARRPFFLLETVSPLSDDQLACLQTAHDSLMQSGIKRLYGLWKLGLLSALAWKTGFIAKTGKSPLATPPAFPICSQAVGYAFWKAGVPIGQMFGKQDCTALLPETFLDEAQAVQEMLDHGRLKKRRSPCYYLHLVQAEAFRL